MTRYWCHSKVILLVGLQCFLCIMQGTHFLVVVHAFSATPTAHATVERSLVEKAQPILASTSKEEAAAQLLEQGVCRLNGIFTPHECEQLKDRIIHFQETEASYQDPREIPKTRLRFAAPILSQLNSRTDVLLPIEDNLVGDALQKLARELGPTLQYAAQGLPSTKDHHHKLTDKHGNMGLELVEAACLISRCGATDQTLHADFRRDASRTETRLPPRLVTFLYLQDTPTIQHGPTIFLPATNNPTAHQSFYEKQQDGGGGVDAHAYTNTKCATLNVGDIAIYDASLLHFGSANSVPENNRAVFYFGVSLEGTTSSDTAEEGNNNGLLQHMGPVSLTAGDDGQHHRFTHETIEGMHSMRSPVVMR